MTSAPTCHTDKGGTLARPHVCLPVNQQGEGYVHADQPSHDLGAGRRCRCERHVRAPRRQSRGPVRAATLPYGEDALAPQISAKTVGLHYGKHHKAYFTKLNELAPGTKYADMSLDEVVVASKKDGEDKIFNQAGQAWNHIFYWEQFKGGPAAPTGRFAEAIERDFGGVDPMVEAFGKTADTVFGTGWVWLVASEGKLSLKGYQDAGGPLPEGATPLVGHRPLGARLLSRLREPQGRAHQGGSDGQGQLGRGRREARLGPSKMSR